MKAPTPTTMTELRNHLLETFTQIRSGSAAAATSREESYAAGKIIASTVAQLKYRQLRKETPSIPFLE